MQYQVLLNPTRLAGSGLSVADVGSLAGRQQCQRRRGLLLRGRAVLLRARAGARPHARGHREHRGRGSHGTPVLVKDVGEVTIGHAPRLGQFGFNGQQRRRRRRHPHAQGGADPERAPAGRGQDEGAERPDPAEGRQDPHVLRPQRPGPPHHAHGRGQPAAGHPPGGRRADLLPVRRARRAHRGGDHSARRCSSRSSSWTCGTSPPTCCPSGPSTSASWWTAGWSWWRTSTDSWPCSIRHKDRLRDVIATPPRRRWTVRSSTPSPSSWRASCPSTCCRARPGGCSSPWPTRRSSRWSARWCVDAHPAAGAGLLALQRGVTRAAQRRSMAWVQARYERSLDWCLARPWTTVGRLHGRFRRLAPAPARDRGGVHAAPGRGSALGPGHHAVHDLLRRVLQDRAPRSATSCAASRR